MGFVGNRGKELFTLPKPQDQLALGCVRHGWIKAIFLCSWTFEGMFLTPRKKKNKPKTKPKQNQSSTPKTSLTCTFTEKYSVEQTVSLKGTKIKFLSKKKALIEVLIKADCSKPHLERFWHCFNFLSWDEQSLPFLPLLLLSHISHIPRFYISIIDFGGLSPLVSVNSVQDLPGCNED